MIKNDTFEVLLEAIAEKLKRQDEELSFYKWKSEDLQKRLEEAEQHGQAVTKC